MKINSGLMRWIVGLMFVVCIGLSLASGGGSGSGDRGGDSAPSAPNGIIGDSVVVNNTFFGAGTTTDVATFNMNLLGGRKLLVIPTISGLTFSPSPADYGGKNHALHVDVHWNILVDGVVKTTFSQNSEQGIIQLQWLDNWSPAGLMKAITLQAVNASYWSLDDPPYGTFSVGSNGFSVVLSAIEFDRKR